MKMFNDDSSSEEEEFNVDAKDLVDNSAKNLQTEKNAVSEVSQNHNSENNSINKPPQQNQKPSMFNDDSSDEERDIFGDVLCFP